MQLFIKKQKFVIQDANVLYLRGGGAYTTKVVIRNVIITLMTLEGCLHAVEVLFFPHFSLFCDM